MHFTWANKNIPDTSEITALCVVHPWPWRTAPAVLLNHAAYVIYLLSLNNHTVLIWLAHFFTDVNILFPLLGRSVPPCVIIPPLFGAYEIWAWLTSEIWWNDEKWRRVWSWQKSSNKQSKWWMQVMRANPRPNPAERAERTESCLISRVRTILSLWLLLKPITRP